MISFSDMFAHLEAQQRRYRWRNRFVWGLILTCLVVIAACAVFGAYTFWKVVNAPRPEQHVRVTLPANDSLVRPPARRPHNEWTLYAF